MTAPTTTAPAVDPATAPTGGSTGDNAGGEGLAPSRTTTRPAGPQGPVADAAHLARLEADVARIKAHLGLT